MNKKHWNTVILNGQIPAKQIREMIDESYDLVVQSLPLKERKKLGYLEIVPVSFYFFFHNIRYQVPDGFSFFQHITDMGSRNLQ